MIPFKLSGLVVVAHLSLLLLLPGCNGGNSGKGNGVGLPEADDHGNTCDTAAVVNSGSSTSGVLEVGNDVDVFRITLPEEGFLTLTTTGNTDTFGTVKNLSGDLVAVDDDSGSNSNFALSPFLSAGTYCIEVRGFSSSTTGTYTLTASFEEDDHDGTCETATVIRPDSSTSGVLEVGNDVDVFRLTLPSDGLLTATTTGDAHPVGAVLDIAGNVIVDNNDGGSDPNFTISTFLFMGAYCIEIRGSGMTATRNYTLSTRFEAGEIGDDHSNTCDTATVVSPGSSISGALEVPDDIDMFRLTLPSSGLLTAATTGNTDTFGIVLDEAGETLARDNNSALNLNFVVFLALPAGTYCVAVIGATSTSTGRYTFVSSFDPNPGPSVGSGPPLERLTAIAVEANGDFVVAGLLGTINTFGAAVVRINPMTGDRTIVSGCPDVDLSLSSPRCVGAPIGSGPTFRNLTAIATEANDTLLVTDDFLLNVMRVNLITGDRTFVSGCEDVTTLPEPTCVGIVGNGPLFLSPEDIAIEADGNLVVADSDLNAVVGVDVMMGDRIIVASDPPFEFPIAIDVETGGHLIVADRNRAAMVRVEPLTGNHTIVSGCVDSDCTNRMGQGQLLFFPVGVAIEPDGNWVVALDTFGLRAVVRVDAVTGDRSIVSR